MAEPAKQHAVSDMGVDVFPGRARQAQRAIDAE
jgi:hypothetical protein